MLFEPSQIEIMREALQIAEQALQFRHPDGLDEAIRRGLARSILITTVGGIGSPLVLASNALAAYATRPADAA